MVHVLIARSTRAYFRLGISNCMRSTSKRGVWGGFFFLHGRMYNVIRLDLHSTKKFLFMDLPYRVSTQISPSEGTYIIEPFRSKLEEKKT
jgi:hypothetical protein